MFGCCCGSTGSGLLLLRIPDPHLDSQVLCELAFFNVANLLFSGHILMVMAPALPAFPLGTFVGVYAAAGVFLLLLLTIMGKKIRI